MNDEHIIETEIKMDSKECQDFCHEKDEDKN